MMPCSIIPMDPSVRQWSGGWLLGEPLKNGEPLVGQWLRRGCAHILGFLIYGVQYWQVGILTELPAMFFAFIFAGTLDLP